MFLSKKLNKGAGTPAPPAPDAQFNYVTMLLHGDGTNGAQNNTFLDSSTNNFTITRNGNTTQGSFSPYGSNWSNYFLSASGFLNVASSANLASNTSSFTLEFWYNSTVTGNGRPMGNGNNQAFSTNKWVFTSNNSAGKLEFYVFNYSGASPILSSTSSTVASDGLWHHIVLVRSSNTWAMFIDGARQGSSVTSSVSFNGTSSAFSVGYGNISGETANAFAGYLSNVRFVNGTAVYDPTQSTLTVPTTPLTAITNTALLTCADNRFIDDSTNNFTLTATGTPSVQRFNPFGTATAYSTSVIGGSGYFDGSGDTLDVPTSSNNSVGTGSFCFEAWIYMQNSSAQQFLVANASSGGLFIGFNIDTANRLALGRVATAIDNEVTYTWVNNQWYHVAVNRNGTSLQFFVNGVQVGSTGSNSVNYSNQGYRVGSETTQKYFTGYMTDFRLTRDSVYTTTFTPNTAPLTAITNTAVLLNYTNGAIFDNAMMNDLETVGNAQISTSVKKYGTGSLAFDGTGDYLLGQSSSLYAFNTGDFTIEAWIYPTSTSDFRTIFTTRGVTANAVYFGLQSGSLYPVLYTDAMVITSSIAVSLNAWTHVALVRVSGVSTIYVGGVSGGSATNTTNYTQTACVVGYEYSTSQYPWIGYIDDLRVTKGYARYTTTFTPPTAAFPNIGPV